MRCHALPTLLLTIAAGVSCGPVPPADTTEAAGSSGGAASTGEGSTGAPTTGDDTGSTGAPGTGSTGGTGGVPDGCTKPLPAPTSCDPVADACGNATPIAGASDGFIREVALTADHVWFLASRLADPQDFSSGCPEALYRVPKRGGEAQWVRWVPDLVAFEADDDAVYLVERTDDDYTMRVKALVDGVETLIGETHGMPRENTYWTTSLTRTRAGVLTYDALGPIHPSFDLLSPTELTALASAVEGGSLGSAPAFDGERLFFVWSDSFVDPNDDAIDRTLVGLAGGVSTTLADGALARIMPSVAVDDTDVFFVIGDPSILSSMSVARVAKTGGPVTPLFPLIDDYIDQVLVGDDADVYYRMPIGDIFAVSKSGGAPRHVWHSDWGYSGDAVHMDAHHLYFDVRASGGDIPQPGRDFIVRVPRDTALP